MSFLGLGEPSLGTFIILLGIFVNRDTTYTPPTSWLRWRSSTPSDDDVEKRQSPNRSRSRSPLLEASRQQSNWRQRELSLFGFSTTVHTPNTARFRDTLPSRILRKFPYTIEVVYWALIYSIYQMARGQLANARSDTTVADSRRHALQVVNIEKHLHLFIELPIQQFFLQYPGLMFYINWAYSFVHLPATITFLVALYWYCITRNRTVSVWQESPAGPSLYESRRRALAFCNLISFIVFAAWPCMPPRLLDDENANEGLEMGPKFGFVDTVHGSKSTVSFWNNRKYTNQLAAMPSMHFGYSLLIGLTVMLLPLPYDQTPRSPRSPTRRLRLPFGCCVRMPRNLSPLRVFLLIVGFSYPFTILTVIIATANHFVLDAIIGGSIAIFAWRSNGMMLNLRVFEDFFFWAIRTYKPVPEETMDEYERGRTDLLAASSSSTSRSASGRSSPD